MTLNSRFNDKYLIELCFFKIFFVCTLIIKMDKHCVLFEKQIKMFNSVLFDLCLLYTFDINSLYIFHFPFLVIMKTKSSLSFLLNKYFKIATYVFPYYLGKVIVFVSEYILINIITTYINCSD